MTALPSARLATIGLCKAYAVPVLQGVGLTLAAGEVHALVGENGAGKSTLARIIAGLVLPDAGQMKLDGNPFAPATTREASQRGVRIVQQELTVLPTLTIAENLYLDQLPQRGGLIQRADLRAAAWPWMERLGLQGFHPDQLVGQLGIGHQQLVEIARALVRPCRLLILDEPTAALTGTETELLFAQIARLRAAGTSIIYISHRLEELTQVADRLSVLRDGNLVATLPMAGTLPDQIVRLMVGRDVNEVRPPHRQPPQPEVALRVTHLQAGSRVRDVSFEAHRGEILGFAGLMGAGRTETMRALFGADPHEGGTLTISGHPFAPASPRDGVRGGLALVTENRKEEGLLLPLSIAANMTLGVVRTLAGRSGCLIDHGREEEHALTWISRLGIRCQGPAQPVKELSGGNQQKVVIARWLAGDPSIVIFDEPTRGIDVGARFEIYKVLWALADEGKAVLVVSSDLRELMLLCDRIAVLSLGELAEIFSGPHYDQEAIARAALSRHRQAAAS